MKTCVMDSKDFLGLGVWSAVASKMEDRIKGGLEFLP